MNLDELRSVQSKERQTDSLQHLRESFYEDVAAYVSELEQQRDRAAEQADDPFADPEVRRLTDEIETAREVVEAIYDRRLGKLVKRASLAAADMPTEAEGLTAEEQRLFEDLVARIEDNKAHVLDVLEGEADADAGAVGTSPAADATSDTPAADAMKDSPPTDATPEDPDRDEVAAEEAASVVAPDDEPVTIGDEPADADEYGEPAGPPEPEDAPDSGESPDARGTPGTDRDANGAEDPKPDGGAAGTAPGTEGLDDRTTVRITGDVGEFFGVDEREYDLEREDVVTLPAANAEPLLEAGDAERLD